MKTVEEWTEWQDEHPVRAAIGQLLIWALIWVAVLAVIAVAAFLMALLGSL